MIFRLLPVDVTRLGNRSLPWGSAARIERTSDKMTWQGLRTVRPARAAGPVLDWPNGRSSVRRTATREEPAELRCVAKKGRRERSTRSSNRLPAPNGLGIRFRRSSRNLLGLENDLFRLESQGNHFLSSGIQGQAEAVVVRAVRRVVRVAVRRPAIPGPQRTANPCCWPRRRSLEIRASRGTPPAPPGFVSLRQNRSAIRLRHLRSLLRRRSLRACARWLRSLD